MNKNLIIGSGIALLLVIAALIAFNMQPSTQNQANVMPTEEPKQMETQTETVIVTPTVNEEEKANQTIVDIAIDNENFSTLVTAVKEAGLVETLSSVGPFTVFAPTNEAFAKLPKETLDAVLKDKEKLKSILTYHVVSGNVMASDVVKLTEATTVNGQKVTVKVMDGKVTINDANVVTTDIKASNGVIHVIDTVLLPK